VKWLDGRDRYRVPTIVLALRQQKEDVLALLVGKGLLDKARYSQEVQLQVTHAIAGLGVSSYPQSPLYQGRPHFHHGSRFKKAFETVLASGYTGEIDTCIRQCYPAPTGHCLISEDDCLDFLKTLVAAGFYRSTAPLPRGYFHLPAYCGMNGHNKVLDFAYSVLGFGVEDRYRIGGV
jgi:hypothetical protein